MRGNLDLPIADAGAAHYRFAWLSLVIGAISACAVLWTTGLRVTLIPLLSFAGLIGLLFLAHHAYRTWRDEPKLALITGALALMIAAALLAGITANGGLRLRFPLLDGELAALDRAAGFDTPAIVLATAKAPLWSGLLGLAYSSIFPLSFLTAIWLGFRGQAGRLWELVLGFAAPIQIAAIICVFVPAIGNIAHSGLGYLAGNGLPEGAGVYFLHAFRTYRDGAGPVLDLWNLEGVVTFPSFHVVMAIVVAWAFRGNGLISWIVAIWCVLVGISTVPIGGHYVVDLPGGALLWGAVMAVAKVPRTAREGRRLASAVPEAVA
jgi:membrane-associated phospholipid phosphatase